MEDHKDISSEQELLELRNQGKISSVEYEQLREAMANRGSGAEGCVEARIGRARLSKSAVCGAFWAMFFFIALVLSVVSRRAVAVRGEGPVGPAWWQYVLMFTVLPMGLTAPFGTTICGLISISQIRHSGGRLYGLGLAVVDTVVFPLLLLLGICYWFVTVVNKVCVSAGIYCPDNPLNQKEAMLGTAFVIWAILALLFARWVWRGAGRGLESSSARGS
ncbi:MAG: hypothetical protein ACYST6_07295 [Planctomycetota bacterium]|jgi:hypothetical protein